MRNVSSVPSCCTEMGTTDGCKKSHIQCIVATIAQSALISLDSQQFPLPWYSSESYCHSSTAGIPKLIQEAQVPTTQGAKQVQLVLSNRCLVQHRTPNWGIFNSALWQRHQSSIVRETPWYLDKYCWPKALHCHHSLRIHTTSPLHGFFFFSRTLSLDSQLQCTVLTFVFCIADCDHPVVRLQKQKKK